MSCLNVVGLQQRTTALLLSRRVTSEMRRNGSKALSSQFASTLQWLQVPTQRRRFTTTSKQTTTLLPRCYSYARHYHSFSVTFVQQQQQTGGSDDSSIPEAEIVSERFSTAPSSSNSNNNNNKNNTSLQQQEQEELDRLDQELQIALKHHQDVNTRDSLEDLRDAYESLAYWDRALTLQEQLYAPDLPVHERADNLYRQGKLHMRLENPVAAQRFYQQALDLLLDNTSNKDEEEEEAANQTTSTKKTPEQGNILISMAGIHFHAGNLDKALQQLKEAEEYFYDDQNEPHKDLVKCLEHAGLVARTQEDYKRALRYYKRALQELEHINFTQSLWQGEPLEDAEEKRQGLLMDMADMHAALDEYEAALRIYREVQKRANQQKVNRDNNGGEETALDAVLLHNMGKIHAQQNKLPLALKELRRAARIKERVFGDSHPETGKTMSALGAVCSMTDNPREALEVFQQALLIARMHAESDQDPEVLLAMRNIAVLEGKKVAKWGADDDDEQEKKS